MSKKSSTALIQHQQFLGASHALNFSGTTNVTTPLGQAAPTIDRVEMAKLSLDESFVNIGDV